MEYILGKASVFLGVFLCISFITGVYFHKGVFLGRTNVIICNISVILVFSVIRLVFLGIPGI